MNDTHIYPWSFSSPCYCLVGIWLSKRGENTRTVITGPAKMDVSTNNAKGSLL